MPRLFLVCVGGSSKGTGTDRLRAIFLRGCLFFVFFFRRMEIKTGLLIHLEIEHTVG